MKKFFVAAGFAFILSGCSVFLRYNYERVFQQLPACSRLVQINNDYITYYVVEGEFNGTTNYYKAHYDVDGKVYKTELVK